MLSEPETNHQQGEEKQRSYEIKFAVVWF